MIKMKLIKYVKQAVSISLIGVMLNGCIKLPSIENQTVADRIENSSAVADEQNEVKKIPFELIPETFSMILTGGERSVVISLPGEKRKVENYTEGENETSWTYPDDQISIVITQKGEYLDISIKSLTEKDLLFQWPNVWGDSYYIPFGEGKKIPADDAIWNQYLRGGSFSTIEQLSMPFWSVVTGDQAVTYILDYPYYSSLDFIDQDQNSFVVMNEFPEIDQKKERHILIARSEHNPVKIAKVYRNYVTEKGNYVTLAEKAQQNPEVEKLYGAPHIYLWANELIAPENVNWPAFCKEINSDVIQYLKKRSKESDEGAEVTIVFDELASRDYVSEYQKRMICQMISQLLFTDDFYDETVFEKVATKQLLADLKQTDHKYQKMGAHKQILAASLPDVFKPVEEWVNEETVDLIENIRQSGIDRAWIGLSDLEMIYNKPQMAAAAVQSGFLIGAYDSYHSIHEPGKEQWGTAAFENQSLYEQATVIDKNGKKISGFKNVGRKLNPTLSLPSVKKRMDQMLAGGITFNSWFIDCDATGEIYDDYTPGHITTKEQDLQARLERMRYIRDEKNLVIGSEGGHDFAASTIAFAHGIELPAFAWMDPDMKQNKESKYYIGRYYSVAGGVAEHFSRQIPVKDYYYQLFLNMKYQVPLYKLVYNNSVITSYHWDWPTFKIKDAVNDRMLREILYNVPPLYHLDKEEWTKYQDSIVTHTKIWSDFSRRAVQQEMTDFRYLTANGLVQKTVYGDQITVVANFSDESFLYQEQEITPHSLLIQDQRGSEIYIPDDD